MTLRDLINRSLPLRPWQEGEKIPWSDPAFSERMLQEHLSQAHDLASRRAARLDQQVAWIHREVLCERPARVLDLGCGPGLYTSRLARLGHTCVGIDYSPASIRYAREEANGEGLACEYRQEDLRTADYGRDFDLVMLIFGEFNVFSPADAARIVDKGHAALVSGGSLLLEPHTFGAVRQAGDQGRSWYTAPSGLFLDRPHLVLEETAWDEESRTATSRFFIVEADGKVTQHGSTMQAYRDDEYRALLTRHGFREVRFFPSLTGGTDNADAFGLFGLLARG